MHSLLHLTDATFTGGSCCKVDGVVGSALKGQAPERGWWGEEGECQAVACNHYEACYLMHSFKDNHADILEVLHDLAGMKTFFAIFFSCA